MGLVATGDRDAKRLVITDAQRIAVEAGNQLRDFGAGYFPALDGACRSRIDAWRQKLQRMIWPITKMMRQKSAMPITMR